MSKGELGPLFSDSVYQPLEGSTLELFMVICGTPFIDTAKHEHRGTQILQTCAPYFKMPNEQL